MTHKLIFVLDIYLFFVYRERMSLSYAHFVVNPYQSNTYVVYDTQTLDALIIDPANWTSQERSLVSAFIRTSQLVPKGIVNTHMHLDHNAANVYYSKLYGIPVYAHEGDAFMLVDRAYLSRRADRIPPEGLGQIDHYLHHEQLLALGGSTLRVIHTPGHSPGSICLYAEAEGFLLSGDTLFFESIGRSDMEGGCEADLLRHIVRRLFVLPDETVVLPGHEKFTTIGHERKFSPFF